MIRRPKALRLHVQNALAVVFLTWLSWASVHGLWKVLSTGTIKGRRGPDINVSENPLVFWGLSGFFGLGTILVGGVAVFYLWIAVRNISRK